MSAVIKGKLTKRKRQPVEFGTEGIDNTAPVKKILNDLKVKNGQAYAFYCQTLRQRRTTKEHNRNYHYTVCGHPLNAFPEDWDGDLHGKFFEPFSYKCLMPKIITKMYNVQKNDPVTAFMKLKSDWSRDCRSFRISAACSNTIEKYESLNEDVVQCPKHIINMAAHLDSDPDPYFNSSYNWYYAGNGNIQVICIDGVDYLLHSEFSTMYITEFNFNDTSIKHDHAVTYNCEDYIFETICSTENIIALRMKTKVILLKIKISDDLLKLEKLKAMESKLPFTGISFDNHHKNILYITSLDNKLTIVNIDRLKGRTVNLQNKIDSVTDNWSTVISSERGFYTHISKNCVTFYDKRTNNPGLRWNGVKYITDDIGCNDITVAKQWDNNNALYLGTDHHLFLMDIRSQNKTKIVQRWTHGMQCVPTYLSMCKFEFNKALICLSSQWCEDMCVITNYIDAARGSEISGITIPYRPPSLLNTLNEAQQKLLCFDLYNPIDNRLCTAITGNMIIEHGENYIILMQNSLGDISCHKLYPEHMEPFIVDDGIDLLHEWSKVYKMEQKSFEVSSIVDFAEIWRKLKRVPESHKIGEGNLMKFEKCKYNEKEIFDAFENEELDSGLLDVWIMKQDEKTAKESSFALNISDSDSDK